ncbi:MAG: caspase family protein [Verrucomicrobiaceae bacterium]|nr:caspase family protein [Verrucomicrobiaceae bacterium]
MKHLSFIASLVLASSLVAADRVALVIGNGAYPGGGRLENPVRDARAVGAVLQQAGFEVIALEDARVESIYEGLERLKQRLAGGKIGLVFYAGHGVEVEGKNYLLPVDAGLESAAQLRIQAVALDTVLEDLKSTRCTARLVILDCCRNNPLTRSWLRSRSVGGGLAEVGDASLPESTMIMFSAGPGQMALDGTGENSPFTAALVKHMRQPGLSLFDAFIQTSDEVSSLTQKRQEPWVKFDGAGRVFREFSFQAGAATPKASVPLMPPALKPAPVAVSSPAPSAPASDPALDKEDAMRGVREKDTLTGELLTTGVCIRNAGKTAIQYQVLTESGWQTRTLGAGTEKVVIQTHGGGIRVKQSGRFRKVPMTGFTQPHYEFNDPNLNNIERMARARPNVLRARPDGDVELD